MEKYAKDLVKRYISSDLGNESFIIFDTFMELNEDDLDNSIIKQFVDELGENF